VSFSVEYVDYSFASFLLLWKSSVDLSYILHSLCDYRFT
jgi:hypothetical protein